MHFSREDVAAVLFVFEIVMRINYYLKFETWNIKFYMDYKWHVMLRTQDEMYFKTKD